MATSPIDFTALASSMLGEASPQSSPTEPSPSSASPTAPSSAPTEASPSAPADEKVTVTPSAPEAPAAPAAESVEDEYEVNFDDEPPAAAAPAAPGEEKGEDKNAAAPAKSEQEEVDDLAQQIKAGVFKNPDEVEAAFLRTARGRQQLSDFKLMRQLAEPPQADGTGGLGFRPSIEQIKQFHTASAELAQLDDMFYSGRPDQQEQFWGQWFSKGPDGKAHQQGISAASTIAAGLFKSDPAYYRAAADVFYKDAADHFFSLAKDPSISATPKERAGWLDAARVLTHFVNPNAPLPELPKEYIQSGVMPPSPKPTPAEQELAQLKAQQAEREASERKHREESTHQSITSSRQKLVKSDIDRALRFLEPAAKDHPTLVNQAKIGLYHDVIDSLKQNKAGMVEYNRLYQKAMQSGQPSDIEAASAKFREIARPVIKHLTINKYYKDYSPLVVKQSSERHARASEAAQKAGTTVNGQPAAQPAGAVLRQQPGETHEQMLKRTFQGILGQG